MKITVKQLKQLIREQVEEMADMSGAMEGRRDERPRAEFGRWARGGVPRRDGRTENVYTPKDLVKLARRDPKQLENIGRDARGGEPQEAFIEFPSGRQFKISSVMVDEYGDVQVDFVSLAIDPIVIPLASPSFFKTPSLKI